MKDSVPNPQLQASRISATVSEGFTVTTGDGKPARLAIIDDQGNVIEAGADVAWAAWKVCIEVQENFWEGLGHLVVHSSPPGDLKLAAILIGKKAA
ncbi:hypothetical protein NAU58_17965 [Pseudomonas stutzeri]|uniref:Uncharacterized protein n=1 Tax=Stutzerimonas stutzeri TaxID=316 RepID=A0A2N8RYZ4_STUST|nr:hypothetical protein [Stutzerimonas stutzeri]MCQ4297467.1 hypothetical protein [Stutzerimonas stutzeri]PNF79605.1 hypothetical protein CXK92_13220 [Stutzerimonas stutzeri]